MNKVNKGRKVEDVKAAPEGETGALQIFLAKLGGLVGGHPVVALAQLFVFVGLGVDPSDEEPGPRLGRLFLLFFLDPILIRVKCSKKLDSFFKYK